MELLAAVRLTAQLNALAAGTTTIDRAAVDVTGDDLAHHLADPDALLGGDQDGARLLGEVLGPVAARDRSWVLALPTPGHLGILRGPVALNQAALERGSAVLALSGGVGLVPYRVGPGVQWRVFEARPAGAPASPSEAERMLSQAILAAARTLTDLDVASGARPRFADTITLAPGYPPRQVATADRAARLLVACAAALEDDGRSISSFEIDARARELRTVNAAAREALAAATTWLP